MDWNRIRQHSLARTSQMLGPFYTIATAINIKLFVISRRKQIEINSSRG